jgi:hypothetical protein
MTEQQIRDALRGVADAPGPADERAAWDAIRTGIERDTGRRRLRNGVLAGGIALAGAAAAVAIVVAAGDSEQSVEMPPATDPPGVVAGLPDRPLGVVVEVDGTQRLDLYDADTGERVTTGLAESVHSIADVSVAPDGTVYFTEEHGDSSVVQAVPWDGSDDPGTPFGAEATETSSPALNGDGSLFAYVHAGITVEQPSVVLVDTGSGERWSLSVDAGRSVRDLHFSPSGDELFLTLDGAPWVADASPGGLGQPQPLANPGDGFVADAAFSADFEVVLLDRCCAPAFEGERTFTATGLDGPSPLELPSADGVARFDIEAGDGTMAVVRDDGSLTVGGRPIEIEGSARDVGF